jgi:hypothetical protein
VTKGEYASLGSPALGAELVAQLRGQGRNPFLIPVGGSNALGTWGYIQAIEEILQHSRGRSMTDIVMVGPLVFLWRTDNQLYWGWFEPAECGGSAEAMQLDFGTRPCSTSSTSCRHVEVEAPPRVLPWVHGCQA